MTLIDALGWWTNLLETNTGLIKFSRSYFTAKYFPGKATHELNFEQVFSIYKEEQKMEAQFAIEQQRIVDSRIKYEAIEFAKYIAGYENLVQAIKFFNCETTEELYDIWKQIPV